MEYRIGGDFELSVRQLIGPTRGEKWEVNPNKEHILFVDTGRSAILVALLNILKNAPIEGALLPFYCCPTVIAPFRQLGIEIEFYTMGNNLDEPFGLPEDLGNKIVLFIHYFGVRNSPMEDYISVMRSRNENFYVIEDCVQTCASVCFGKCGDYVVHSLRKFLPMPDGGIVASDLHLDADGLQDSNEAFISQKFLSKLIRGSQGPDTDFLSLYERAERIIDDTIYPRAMSALSRFIYDRTDLEQVVARRINNWTYVSNAFEKRREPFKNMRPLYKALEPGEVPLVFPIVSNGNRDCLKNYLGQHNIFCPVHWHLSERDQAPGGAADYRLSRSVLSLPIDQRINEKELDYLLYHLNQFDRVTS